MRFALMFAAMVCLGYLGLCLILYLLQGRMLYQPVRRLAATPADAGLPFDSLMLPSGGETIHAWRVPAPPGTARTGTRGPGTVLFCHGNAGNISHRLETLVILHRLGLETLIFDYQGYGESTGTPSEEATAADARACWDWLVHEAGREPGRIVVMGRSLGGAVAAGLVHELHREAGASGHEPPAPVPAGLVLESTFTSVPDMGASLYPFLPVRTLARFDYDTLSLLPEVRCPVLVAHSPDDDMVPHDMGRRLLAAAREPKAFLALTGDHNTGFLLAGDAYEQGLARFFGRVLDGGERGS